MSALRMYVNRACPNCEAATKFFAEKKVPIEQIEIGFDPIISNGIRAIANGQLPLPVIVSFVTQEVVYGNDPAQLQRLADAVFASSAIAFQPAPDR